MLYLHITHRKNNCTHEPIKCVMCFECMQSIHNDKIVMLLLLSSKNRLHQHPESTSVCMALADSCVRSCSITNFPLPQAEHE